MGADEVEDARSGEQFIGEGREGKVVECNHYLVRLTELVQGVVAADQQDMVGRPFCTVNLLSLCS